jgi:hypothetical protein
MVTVSNRWRLALYGLTAAALSGCPCDAGLSDLFADELREDCDGLPCGWALSAGDARFVPFLHESERALELAGTLTRPLSGFSLTAPVQDEAQVYVLAKCERATELVVVLETDADPPRNYEARLDAGTPTGGLPLPRHELPLVFLAEDGDPEAPQAGLVAFRAMALRVEGPGRCTVSDLHVVSTQVSSCF